MPPRIPTQRLQAVAELSSRATSSTPIAVASASPLEQALQASKSSSFSSALLPSSRSFSTTTSRDRRTAPLAKQQMEMWFKKRKDLKNHQPGQVNYLNDSFEARSQPNPARSRPFPSNPSFTSTSVLSEEAREMIWDKVVEQEEPVKAVSAELGVDQRRVAAIVRMKEIEKEWQAKGIPLATPYSKAVLEMLPTHSYPADQPIHAFEPINEIHVHGYTMQQLFVPTSESRQFTRQDAATAFHHTMLPADRRIPHPELVEMERRVKDGMKERESWELFKQETRRNEDEIDARVAERAEREEKKTTKVKTDRFEFRFKKMAVEDVGKDGRARSGVGWRYGIPFEDRKKNQVKIPTKMD